MRKELAILLDKQCCPFSKRWLNLYVQATILLTLLNIALAVWSLQSTSRDCSLFYVQGQRPSWRQGQSSFHWTNAVDNHPWRQSMIQSWRQGMSSLTWCTIHHSSLASIKHIDASSINPNCHNANHLGLNANNLPLWHWWQLESFFLPLWHQGQRVYRHLLSNVSHWLISPPDWLFHVLF